MPRAARAIVPLMILAACATRQPVTQSVLQPAPQPVMQAPPSNPGTTIYTRIPSQVGAYKLTERAVVRAAPTDSLFRFSNGSNTIVTVFVYEVPPDVRVDADSQKWTAREGDKFKQVQAARQQRGDFSEFVVSFSDSTRFAAGGRQLLEHKIGTPVRLNSGAIVIDFQFLYLIDGRFLKVRATVPEAGWQETTVGGFARELARLVAGPG